MRIRPANFDFPRGLRMTRPNRPKCASSLEGLIMSIMKPEWTLITQGIHFRTLKDDKTKKDDLIMLNFILPLFNRLSNWLGCTSKISGLTSMV